MGRSNFSFYFYGSDYGFPAPPEAAEGFKWGPDDVCDNDLACILAVSHATLCQFATDDSDFGEDIIGPARGDVLNLPEAVLQELSTPLSWETKKEGGAAGDFQGTFGICLVLMAPPPSRLVLRAQPFYKFRYL